MRLWGWLSAHWRAYRARRERECRGYVTVGPCGQAIWVLPEWVRSVEALKERDLPEPEAPEAQANEHKSPSGHLVAPGATLNMQCSEPERIRDNLGAEGVIDKLTDADKHQPEANE